MMPYDIECPFGDFRSAVPAVSIPMFMCTPNLLTCGLRSRKDLDTEQCLHRNEQKIPVLSVVFSVQNQNSHYGKKYLYPSQTSIGRTKVTYQSLFSKGICQWANQFTILFPVLRILLVLPGERELTQVYSAYTEQKRVAGVPGHILGSV